MNDDFSQYTARELALALRVAELEHEVVTQRIERLKVARDSYQKLDVVRASEVPRRIKGTEWIGSIAGPLSAALTILENGSDDSLTTCKKVAHRLKTALSAIEELIGPELGEG